MTLSDIFKSIEQHAEAIGVSDRSAYFIHPFGMMPCKDPRMKGESDGLLLGVKEGVVLLMDESVSDLWKQNKPSLWCGK